MTFAADAHGLTLHETNSHAVIAVCACGWSGNVHPSFVPAKPGGKRGRRNYDAARGNAAAEHRQHLKLAGPIPVTMPVEQFIPAVLNTRRFGHH